MIGFQILERIRAVSPQTVAQFKTLPVAIVSDTLSRMFSANANLRPMHNGHPMVGPALTVKTRPGDNLMVHKAIQMAQAGDVIVVDGGGDLTNALIGEIMSSYAASKQIAGMVINGSVRDAGFLRTQDFGVFAAGVTHRGPYKDGPGEINVPIALGGMVIEPGDLVMGDEDGVLCVPFDQTLWVYQAAKDKQNQESDILKKIHANDYHPTWIDEVLAQKLKN
jgi:RraA family protein